MSLDIRVYQRNFQPHANKYIKAFIDGLKRHGLKARWESVMQYEPCDLAVIWGIRHPDIINGQTGNDLDYLVMERGYFGDRMRFCSLGYNGLNGHADFLADKMPSDRWEKHGVEVKPWRTEEGEYWLLMGQVAGDQSVKGVDLEGWYGDIVEDIRYVTDLPVFFRPHPQSRQNDGPVCDGYKTGGLSETLQDAHCVVTYNSNSGVDAALAGVPVIAVNEGAMAWDVSMHEITGEQYLPVRTQWLNDLAYKQWLLEEIASGEAWEHLKRRYE